MIALLMALQQPVRDTNMAVPPRVRAMIESFAPPRPGDPAVSTRFSRDTVWVGEQVEFITVAWIPRPLRDRLHHTPSITPPALNGLWSAHSQLTPIGVPARLIGGIVYDLWVTYQTGFPLAPGRVEAGPAVLSYNLPTSTSYFAPEEHKSVSSRAVVLVARPIPPAALAALGSGPTAHALHLAWHAPASGLQAGSPAIVTLDITGEGNLTLWPAPQIDWPADLHVYPEPTEEHASPVMGVVGGEKHFRFTVVADSAGVLAFPAVSYPYFDPATRDVDVATTAALSLAIRPRGREASLRTPLPIAADAGVPLAAVVIGRWGWPMLLLALALPAAVLVRLPRRKKIRTAAPVAGEEALRAALGTPVDAGPEHVVAALRARGVPRGDAEVVRQWLVAIDRRRYGPTPGDAPAPPAALQRALTRIGSRLALVLLLCAGALSLHAATSDDGVARYNSGDYVGAARAFADVVRAEPAAAGAWRNLGAAHWMESDEVGAAAAWIHAAALAPRDPLLQVAFERAGTIPPDIRALAPSVPVSRDEALMLCAILWLVSWLLVAARRANAAYAAGLLCALAGTLGAIRWYSESRPLALITTATPLRISPHPATIEQGTLASWSMVLVRRRLGGWDLVEGVVSGTGGMPGSDLAGWVPASSVAVVGGVD